MRHLLSIAAYAILLMLVGPMGESLAAYNPSTYSVPPGFSTNNPYPAAPFITPMQYGAICNGLSANAAVDTAGINAALAAALSNNYQTVKAGGICALNSSITIGNFTKGFSLDLGGVIEGASFPVKSTWQTATPFFIFGATGGTQTGINLHLQYATGLDANVVEITGSGLSSSTLDIGEANRVNGVIDIESITNVASDNVFTGNLWSGCDNPTTAPTNPNACGYFGIYYNAGSGAGGAQGNLLKTNWIQNFNVAAAIEYNGTLYNGYYGGMEQNGTWNTQLCLTGVSGTFQIGETVTEGIHSGTVLTPAYSWRNGTNCIQILETRASLWYSGVSHTNFTTSGTLTGATSGATATISSILVTDQLFEVAPFDPESFDIVSAHTDSTMDDTVIPVYLGGIVGPLLPTSDIMGKNGSTFGTCFRGLGVHTTGATDELTNCSNNPNAVIFITNGLDTQLGGYDIGSPTNQTLSVANVAPSNGNNPGGTFTIQGSLSNGSGTGGIINICTTNSSASSGFQNTCSTALSFLGGPGHLILATLLPTSAPSNHCALWSNSGVVTQVTPCP